MRSIAPVLVSSNHRVAAIGERADTHTARLIGMNTRPT
jgi:hypothetical protein